MNIKTIGILTSGGDAPGINPSIRACVRTAIFHGLDVIGIQEGFDGLIRGEMEVLRARDVGGILQRGGTFLRTARCPEFSCFQARARPCRGSRSSKKVSSGLRSLNNRACSRLIRSISRPRANP